MMLCLSARPDYDVTRDRVALSIQEKHKIPPRIGRISDPSTDPLTLVSKILSCADQADQG